MPESASASPAATWTTRPPDHPRPKSNLHLRWPCQGPQKPKSLGANAPPVTARRLSPFKISKGGRLLVAKNKSSRRFHQAVEKKRKKEQKSRHFMRAVYPPSPPPSTTTTGYGSWGSPDGAPALRMKHPPGARAVRGGDQGTIQHRVCEGDMLIDAGGQLH